MKRSFALTLGLGLFLASIAARAETIEMKVFGMVCSFCAQGIEDNLRKIPATADVLVSLENKLVVVTTQGGEGITDSQLAKAINDAGYDLKGIERTDRSLAQIRSDVLQAKAE
jgi:mercuric ion binding protein